MKGRTTTPLANARECTRSTPETCNCAPLPTLHGCFRGYRWRSRSNRRRESGNHRAECSRSPAPGLRAGFPADQVAPPLLELRWKTFHREDTRACPSTRCARRRRPGSDRRKAMLHLIIRGRDVRSCGPACPARGGRRKINAFGSAVRRARVPQRIDSSRRIRSQRNLRPQILSLASAGPRSPAARSKCPAEPCSSSVQNPPTGSRKCSPAEC